MAQMPTASMRRATEEERRRPIWLHGALLVCAEYAPSRSGREDEISYEKDGQGKVIGLIVRYGTQDFHARRLDAESAGEQIGFTVNECLVPPFRCSPHCDGRSLLTSY